MLFNSLQFFFFFIIVYGLYCALDHKRQNVLLIIASCLFYAAWSWEFIGLMFISITTDFFCARYIDQTGDEKRRRMLLFISIFVNLALLAFFKYFNFFSNNLSALIEILFPSLKPILSDRTLDIILPLGISFYTFEAISYTVDVYRRVTKPAQRYWDYVLFVIYFPHLLAGPIMRAKDLLPQIVAPRILRLEQFYEGCYLIFWGLFEKVFIADNLGKIVYPVFKENASYDGISVLIATYAFAFQIFCDFDGYSNIARGLGKCMGFEIMTNFRLPYFSTNPREFWQRWHISLSSWLRDYLYIPLGGNKGGLAKTLRNIMITMLLGGLWHGASWTFVCWGAYHGLLLVLHRGICSISGQIFFSNHRFIQNLWKVLKIIFFFHLTCLGWLIFRSQTMAQVFQMLKALIFDFFPENSAVWSVSLQGLIFYTGFLLMIQMIQFLKNDLLVVFRSNIFARTAFYVICFYLILLFGVRGGKEFIYFQF